VSGIVEGSGAEKAGLKKGDVIIRFDDQEVQDFKSLSTLIKANKSGDVVDVEYVRDGQKQKTKVELGAQQMKVHSYSPNWDQLGKDLGEDMEGLEEQIEKRMKHVQMMYSGDDRAFLGITNGNSEKGVEIGSVIEGSTAEKMGIQKGDQLRKIDGNSIEDFDDVLEALKAKEVGDKVAVELYRDGKKLNLEGELGSRKGYTSKGFSWISDNQQEDVIVRMKIEVADPSTKDLKQLKDKTGEPISIENDLEFKAMEFKPNPTKGRFDLKLDLIKKGETTISLYDVQGRKIFEEIIKNLDSVYEQSFDIRSEPSGIYFLNVRQGAQSMTKKIIKE
jgi:membrane-associated protease RseP (regulator of RpoE activity)